MPATSTLDPRAQFFEGEFKRAWELFDTEQFDAANNIARKLLLEPALGKLHQAGCHLLLAHGPDEYVRHAEKAVELYESLYEGELGNSREDGGPSERQKQSRLTMIQGAQKVLSETRKAAADEVPMTDTEFLQQLEEDAGFKREMAADYEERAMEEENQAWLEESRAKAKANQEEAEAEAAATMATDVPMMDPASASQMGQEAVPVLGEDGDDGVEMPTLPTPPRSRGAM